MIPDLPALWSSARLGLCLKRRRDTVMPATLTTDFVNVLGLEDIQDGGRGGIAIQKMRPAAAESLKTRFYKGDILYGKLRPYLNKVAIAPDDGLCSTEIWAFETESFVDPYFVYAFLSSRAFVERVSGMTKGANLPRLDLEGFESVEIPLPPLSEQQRIVDIVTEAEQIRRLQSLADIKAAQILPASFSSMFGDLASSRSRWPFCKVSDFVAEFTGGKSLSDGGGEVPSGLRVLKISAVTSGRFDPTESKPVPPGYAPEPHHIVKKNDLLISRANTADLVGATALVEDCHPNLLLPDKLWRFVWKDPANTSPEFMSVLFRMPSVRQKISATATGTGGSMKNISMQKLMSLRLSLPPSELQLAFGRIYREMRAINNLSWDDRCASALSNSLFSRAFTGRLTAYWREQSVESLREEGKIRDQALQVAGAIVLSRLIEPSGSLLVDHSGQGVHGELTRDQNQILEQIERNEWTQQDDGSWKRERGKLFTAAEIASALAGSLHDNAQAVESNLAVLVIRGLVIGLSREQRAPDDKTIFGNCYRLLALAQSADEGEGVQSTPVVDDLRNQEILRLLRTPKREVLAP